MTIHHQEQIQHITLPSEKQTKTTEEKQQTQCVRTDGKRKCYPKFPSICFTGTAKEAAAVCTSACSTWPPLGCLAAIPLPWEMTFTQCCDLHLDTAPYVP